MTPTVATMVDDYPKTTNLIWLTCVLNLITVASIIPKLWLGAPKFKIGHVTANMPIWRTVPYPDTNASYGQLVYKIWSL